LLTAFETVNGHFAALFTHLFGGGEAKLVLVESDDPLEAGLEIMAQPPGKKLATLSLLSGGEQTLTALALIFAVFLANPAPICVLDEVDAPLDDANVGRFCDLLDEMTRRTETRFLIITHNAITHGADGPAVWRHHGRAGGQPAGQRRSAPGRGDGCLIARRNACDSPERSFWGLSHRTGFARPPHGGRAVSCLETIIPTVIENDRSPPPAPFLPAQPPILTLGIGQDWRLGGEAGREADTLQ
jgi:hypothetical protein